MQRERFYLEEGADFVTEIESYDLNEPFNMHIDKIEPSYLGFMSADGHSKGPVHFFKLPRQLCKLEY